MSGTNSAQLGQGTATPQRNMDELASLEEAFRYQEMELQRERENANTLQIQLIKQEFT